MLRALRTTLPSRALTITSALILSVLMAACTVFGPDDDDRFDEAREELAAHRDLWRSQGIDSYTYVVRRLCYCGYIDAVRVVVRDGVIVSLTSTETGEPVPATLEELYPKVEALFEFIEDAMARRAHRLDVTYDATLGFPTRASVDYAIEIADEEITLEASAMEPER